MRRNRDKIHNEIHKHINEGKHNNQPKLYEFINLSANNINKSIKLCVKLECM